MTDTIESAGAYWPADTSVALHEVPIGTVLARHAEAVPDRHAVVEWLADPSGETEGEFRTWTYGELYAAAVAVARGLLEDAEPGDRIALWGPNCGEWVIVDYAVALAGLTLVPLNPVLTDPEAKDLIERSGAVAVIAVPEYRGRRPLERAREFVGSAPALRRVVALDRVAEELGSSASTDLPTVSPYGPYLIQYTSGTTGKPKGALLNQHAALNTGALLLPLLGVTEPGVWLNPLPLHHVGASVCMLFGVLASGGTIVLCPNFDPGTMLALLEKCRAKVLGAVPTILIAMLEHPDFARRDLSALEVVQIGGSTVAPALIRRAEEALGARIVNAYGQSEAPSAVQTRLADPDEVKALTIGRPGLHREAKIVRPGTVETALHGEAGELWIRSPLRMMEYFADKAHTDATIDSDGWLRTGDLCSMDADGVITIRGRLRDVVIRGGENIYPAEVEDVLLRHPAVADVAVVGAPSERWGEEVAAFVRFRPGMEADWAELEAHAAASLARFKVPRIWRAVEDFPLTPAGKIQKYRLRESLG
ncbi:class I adenylate-forming enzyme family protein [Nocardia aobensis]|uniref:Class I adenylate-forming enzyme family protein n=1 Tax=Nocardia aobensis TaxID=257277 RepID=A0ABW6P9R0_9NOCA